MAQATQQDVGTVASLWRYPVKSMMGEELPAAHVSEYGVLGDRAYGLIDSTDGKVATAKNPSKWPMLFSFRAAFVEPPSSRIPAPPVRIMLSNGTAVTSTERECNQTLSKLLHRQVTLAATARGQVTGVQSSLPASWMAKSEEYWPDMEGLDYRDTVTDFALPAGTFFDGATVHLLTTATLNRLRELYPQGRFEVPRFRPNLVVEHVGGEKGFVEETWIGHNLAIGHDVLLQITGPCGRCVMTTLAQSNLPKDSGILRTAVQHNHGHVGVYAKVVQGGMIGRGDRVRLSE